MLERLYDESEQTAVHFIGYASERRRYDFAIIFTDSFFGKPLVVCMQTGKTSLVCSADLMNYDYLMNTFKMNNLEEAEELSIMLQQRIPSLPQDEQYS